MTGSTRFTLKAELSFLWRRHPHEVMVIRNMNEKMGNIHRPKTESVTR